jgi:energy-coupling factor transporter ATP-binding protein EcfA2
MNENIQTTGYDDDTLAVKISDMWVRWNQSRAVWRDDVTELRNYLFATSTRSTNNSKLPWKNSTVTPKLTQIRDNLHANYMAALFPSENWFFWESTDKDQELAKKRYAIVNYMKQKLKASNFQLLVSQLVYDYIDFGNVVATYDYVRDVISDDDGNVVSRYVGPKAYRINPNDIVFNPLAETFTKTPVVRRMLKSIGDLMTDVETKPALNYSKGVLDKALSFRQNYRDDPEFKKEITLAIDGFGSADEYLEGDMVELLEFWGDIYDIDSKTLLRNQLITVIDRKWILRKQPNPLWTGDKPMFHCGWRLRPDNLWAQGPLDQLVGMQYRIDHLENLKADVFDLIAYPVMVVSGNTVEEFEYEPGATVFVGDEGRLEFLRPDATALQADLQINELMNRMEELAGAPKQAMGIRTPGEKTKYEVQSLENAAGRIFQSKVSWFERNILEPLLNGMLAEAIRNFEGVERIRTVDEDFGTEAFVEVTKDDLMAAGKLYPVGARHFAEQARFVQELAQTIQAVQAMPTVAAHISGKAIAKAIEENMGWSNYKIVQDNAMIFEQAETQRLMNQVAEDIQTEASVDVEGGGEMPPVDSM